ncbi:MAG: MXAN_6640 family putative metalloprotease [bacterium]
MLKQISLVGILSFTLCLLIPAISPGRTTITGSDPLWAIEKDFRDGRLTLDQRTRLVIKAIKNPHELPREYRRPNLALSDLPPVCPSNVLSDIRWRWDELSKETQVEFSQALTRHPTEFTYDSPGGFFKLHYDTSGSYQVPAADDDSNGIPDFVEKCAAYCDTTYNVHISHGFLPPPSDGSLGGDSSFDVYFQEMGYYGYAQPEGPGPQPWNDYYSYLVLNNDFLGFPPNDDPEGDQYGAAKVTCAHEFHHCVQYAYDLGEGMWFMELDAICWEDIIFDFSNDNYNYLGSFFNYPEKSLMENSSHAYSCFIWGLYLAQRFDTSLLVAGWEGARYDNIFSTLSDTLWGRYGWTQDSAFAEFTTWNYVTSSRDDGWHHEEAFDYPLVSVGMTHTAYPVNHSSSPTSPVGYGSCYIQFYPQSYTGILRIMFNGDDSREWSAYLIKSTANDVHQFEKINLDPVTYFAEVDIFEFESYYRVTLVATNIAEFDGGDYFGYSAKILQPYACSSLVLTTDSAVYSGGTRGFEYQVFNTSSLNDVFDIAFWDDRGWVTRDTIDMAIPPQGDTVISIAVNPPPGTPLGTLSNLHFEIRSRGDTSKLHWQDAIAETRLQHGDCDFTGSIEVGDITYLVAYLFTSGSPPVPEPGAGDFNCDVQIDVGDITSLVSYLFMGGSPPPCNPY